MHHRFFTATAGLLLGITLIGFSPSFFLKFVFEHPGGIVEQAELLRRDGGGSGVLPSSSVGEESLSPNHPDTSSRF